jgi:hypothetical protein
VEHTPRWSHAGTHDVLVGLDPMTVDVARAYAYEGDGITAIARSDQGTPLIAVVDRADRRLVIVTFGLGDSNLAFAAAFPVLVGNSLEWLGRPASGDPRGPGLVALPASTAKVTGPDHRAVALARAGNASYARLTAGGFYDVEAGGSHQTSQSGHPRRRISRGRRWQTRRRAGDNPPGASVVAVLRARSCSSRSSGGRGSEGSRCDDHERCIPRRDNPPRRHVGWRVRVTLCSFRGLSAVDLTAASVRR